MEKIKNLPAIFLDRDGVINKDIGYFSDPEKLLIPTSSINGLRKLNDAGFQLVIITNQSGIARGLLAEKDVQFLHNIIFSTLKKYQIYLTGIISCPHHPNEGTGEYTIECDCRKPKPGMIMEAARRFNIDLNNSHIIGDRFSDIQAGINAGLKSSILIKSKHKILEHEIEFASIYCDDLDQASEWILKSNK